MVRVLDTSKIKGLEYPEILSGSWMNFVFFSGHPKLDGICCVYFNDRYPTGTICIDDAILNDYPDIYATWNRPDSDNNIMSDRMFVSKDFRQNGLGKAAIFFGSKCLSSLFNKKLVHGGGSAIGNQLWKSAFGESDIVDVAIETSIDLQEDFFEQPAYPYVFFGKRKV